MAAAEDTRLDDSSQVVNGIHEPSADPSFKPKVIFVLGGPGSGKGTQCAKIVEEFGFTHLSAGDLLRAELKSGSAHGNMIENMIKEGKIVPAEVTVGLLEKAMRQSGNDKFLIDGFPRNLENRICFEEQTGIDPQFILFFDCPEEVMEQRLLGRNQGRIDDNIETIRKRFKVFVEQSVPVVNHYDLRGKVRKVDATKSPDEVFQGIIPYLLPFRKDDLVALTEKLLSAIDKGNYAVWSELCDDNITSFEPEQQGHLAAGKAFHKFFFDLKGGADSAVQQSTVVSPQVALLGSAAVVTYTRLVQTAKGDQVSIAAYNETRVWERCKGSDGSWKWVNVHFHRSACASA